MSIETGNNTFILLILGINARMDTCLRPGTSPTGTTTACPTNSGTEKPTFQLV